MPNDNVTLKSADGTFTFSVPRKVADSMDTDTKSLDYIKKAENLAREARRPIFNNDAKPEGLLSGLWHGTGIPSAISAVTQHPLEALSSAIPPLHAAEKAYNEIAPIISGESNDPNFQTEQKVQDRENIRNLPVISDINRLRSGDYAGEAGELLPSIIGTLAGISPKIRASVPGFVEGYKDTIIPPPRVHSLTGMVADNPLAALGAVAGYSMHPSFEGAGIGAMAGLAAPRFGKRLLGGLKGAASAAEDIPFFPRRIPSYNAEFVEPGPHPFQYGNSVNIPYPEDITGATGNPYEGTKANYRIIPPDRQLPPATPQERVFNMPGSFGAPYGERIADYPPPMIEAPPRFNMPPAGAHLLNPEELKGLPPAPTWTDVSGSPKVTRTRGAIPTSKVGGNTYFESQSQPKVKPPIERTRTGRKYEPESEIKVKNPNVTESKPISSEIKESKAPERKALEVKTKTPESTSSINKKTEIPEYMKYTAPEGEGKFKSMSEVSSEAKKLGMSYGDYSADLKSRGFKIVSDFDLAKKKAGSYGLNIKGRKIGEK